MVVLLFAVSAHEAAHAWMSYKFGDDTARLLGRITLNPVAHTDPVGTLLIPMVMFIFAHINSPLAAIPLLGWGKPTPVNPLRWKNKDLANVMVSIAGILANMLIAIIAFVIFKIMIVTNAGDQFAPSTSEPITLFLVYTLIMNVSLAIFNLFPFPPLDGSKILDSILPASMRPALDFLEQWGFIILIILISLRVTSIIISPVINFIFSLL